MRPIFQISFLLFFVLSFSQSLRAQDSLKYSQTFELENLHWAMCIRWGEDWAEEQFREENHDYVDSIATFIKSNPQAKFELRCYTDSRGWDTSNLSLSQTRADQWVAYLINLGVDSSAIEGIGVGEMFPRTVWCKDTVYYIQQPNDPGAVELQLTNDYINSFWRDRKRFEYLHQLNRRTELSVSKLDRSIQMGVDYDLYLKELYRGKHVRMISAGRIENSDTLRIEHKGDLHLHLIAAGTENEFTIQSLENQTETYQYNKFAAGKETLLDLSKAKGFYTIEVFGDGGSGEMILEIVFDESLKE